MENLESRESIIDETILAFKNAIQKYTDLYGTGEYDIEMNFFLFEEICSNIASQLKGK